MNQPNPVAFSFWGIDIRWYGILIAAGTLLALYISYKRAPKHGIEREHVLDISIIMLPLGILGARFYYVIFNLNYYNGDITEMLNIRNGGLAIHGGIIFGIFGMWLVCNKKHIDFFKMLDLMAPAAALAQSIGRWGNFFNGEAHGYETSVPWAIIVAGRRVHPTFFYESIWCLFLFIILIVIDNTGKSFKGQIISLYIILYSIERFFVEELRTDSLMIGDFKQAQVISAVFVILGAVMYYYFSHKKNNIK